MKKSIILLLYCLGVPLSIVYVLCTSRPHISIVAEAMNTKSPVYIEQKTTKTRAHQRPLPSPSTLEITNSGSNLNGTTPVLTIQNPETLNGGKLDAARLQKTGTWQQKGLNTTTSILETSDPDAQLHWQGHVSGLALLLLKDEGAGSAQINWNGQSHHISLVSPVKRWEKVSLQNSTKLFYTSLSPFGRDLRVLWNPDDVDIRHISITAGNTELFKMDSPPADGNCRIELPERPMSAIMPGLLGSIGMALAICLGLTAIYFLIGLPCSVLLPATTAGVDRFVISVGAGFCFFNTLITSLIFVLPFSSAVLATALTILGLITLLLFTCCRKRWHAAMFFWKTGGATSELLALFAVATCGVIFFFSPHFSEPRWFLGRSLTDSFYYINQAQSLISNPSELIISLYSLFTIRYTDMVTLAANALLLFSDTRESYIFTAMFLWFFLPFICFRLAASVTGNRIHMLLFTMALAWSANLYGLFSYSFLAHYFFAVILLYSFYCCCYYLSTTACHSFQTSNIALLLPVALSFAYCLALYPYHFFLPLSLTVVLITIVLLRIDNAIFSSTIKNIVLLAVLSIVLANINLVLSIVSLRYIGVFNTRLDEITRLLFSFYDSFSLVPIIYGLRDFGGNSGFLTDILRELIPNFAELARRVTPLLKTSGSVLTTTALFLAGIALVHCFRNKNKVLLFLMISVLFYGAIALALLAKDKAYGFLKLALTGGPLLTMMTLAGVHALTINRFPGATAVRWTAGLVVTCMIIMNLFSGFIENSTALLLRQSRLLQKKQLHLPAMSPALKELEEVMAKLKVDSRKNILIIGEATELKYSDTDRVLNNRILHIFREHAVDYSSVTLHYHLGFDFGYTEKLPSKQFDYAFVFRGFERLLQEHSAPSEILLETEWFSLYKLNKR
ncbi:MAG: hypothetical protein BWK76_27840 [Desulfobulbaceae bacterium A2]|nr:MAG: hypothetical protein BWK76_27840 [Desulfobulbaceae bacterium A2]